MNLSGIRPGDIVAVGDDEPYHCLVLERLRGELRVRSICAAKTQAPRLVKARDVTAHWSKRGARP